MTKADGAEPNTLRFHMTMPPSLVEKVDDWRFANRIPTRAKAVRKLIEVALNADATLAEREQGGGHD